jgi:hypothetical protein
VVLLISAGCSTGITDDSSENTSTIAITSTETTERTKTTRQNIETTKVRSQTTSKGYFGSIEDELQVKNYLDQNRSVRVRIESSNGTVVFNKTLHMRGNSSKSFDFEFPYTGEYTIIANTSFSSKTQTWNVERRNPDIAASVVIIGDNELHIDLEAI